MYKLACRPVKRLISECASMQSYQSDGRSMGSQGFNVSSDGKLRLWSDCVEMI